MSRTNRRSRGTPRSRPTARKKDRNKAPWRKPFNWLLAIVVGALGLAITDALVPEFRKGIGRIFRFGDPVTASILSVEQDSGISMAFEPEMHFSNSQAEKIVSNRFDVGRASLESMGGVPVGRVNIKLMLTGNRDEEVQISDLRAVKKECSDPLRGPYFLSPDQGAETAHRLYIDLDDPDPRSLDSPPWLSPEGSSPSASPYFPVRDVSLTKGENLVFVVTAQVDEKYCEFDLELSVFDRGESRTHRIDNNDKPFELTPELPRTEWKQVFIGSTGCDRSVDWYLPAAESWRQGVNRDPCGQFPAD